VDKREPSYIAGGNVNFTVEISQFLKMLNTELPYDPAIPGLGRSRELKIHIYRKTCTQLFRATLLIMPEKAEITQMSIN